MAEECTMIDRPSAAVLPRVRPSSVYDLQINAKHRSLGIFGLRSLSSEHMDHKYSVQKLYSLFIVLLSKTTTAELTRDCCQKQQLLNYCCQKQLLYRLVIGCNYKQCLIKHKLLNHMRNIKFNN